MTFHDRADKWDCIPLGQLCPRHTRQTWLRCAYTSELWALHASHSCARPNRWRGLRQQLAYYRKLSLSWGPRLCSLFHFQVFNTSEDRLATKTWRYSWRQKFTDCGIWGNKRIWQQWATAASKTIQYSHMLYSWTTLCGSGGKARGTERRHMWSTSSAFDGAFRFLQEIQNQHGFRLLQFCNCPNAEQKSRKIRQI